MALIKCPECGKQISETTPSCPHCGYQLMANLSKPQIAPTKIEEPEANKKTGILFLVGGIAMVPISFLGLFIFVIPGIICFGWSILLIANGINNLSGMRSICCPYCGKFAQQPKNFEKYKCPVCKKRSAREGQWLKPV